MVGIAEDVTEDDAMLEEDDCGRKKVTVATVAAAERREGDGRR